MPQITFRNVTSVGFIVLITGLDITYSGNDRTVQYFPSVNGVPTGTSYTVGIPAYVSEGGTWDLTNSGAPPGSTVTFTAIIRYSGGQVNLGPNSVIQTPPTRPPLFYWATNIQAGAPVTSNLTASEWNRFIDTLNKTRLYYDYKFGTNLGNLVIGKVSAGAPIQAAYYNDLRIRIREMTKIGAGGYIQEQAAGAQITAQKILVLQSEINSAINAM